MTEYAPGPPGQLPDGDLDFSCVIFTEVDMPTMTLELSDNIDRRLDEIASKNGITKAEAMRRAFALLSMADKEKSKGNTLAVVKELPDHTLQPVARIVGQF